MGAPEGFLLSDVTFDHFDSDGRLLRQQLEKRVIGSTGLWALVAFIHRSRLRTGDWGAKVLTLARFRKKEGVWRKQSSLNINSVEHIDAIVALLGDWRALMKEDVEE